MMADDIAWFEQNRPMIANSYPGQFVIVKDKAVIAAYPTYEAAYNAGTAMFGTETFLVKEATPSQRVETLTYIGDRRRRLLGAPYADVVEQLRQNGAIVSVQIQTPTALAQQLQAQGRAVPPPQVVRGMIDTGASISTVTPAVAAAAGLQQVSSIQIGGVGGMSTAPLYSTYFGLPEYGVAVDTTEIAGVTVPAPGFDVLVGRDILRALHLDYTGPHGTFVLTQDVAPLMQPNMPSSPGSVAALPSKGSDLKTALGIGAGVAAVVGLLFAFDIL